MNRFLQSVALLLKITWASPYSLVGLAVGLCGLCSGGKVQLRGRALEFYGGGVERFLGWLPSGWVLAITFGHTILARNANAADVTRDHEWVHVRQYELWGPLFIPAYLLCSAVCWLRGERPYRDNPFEKQAYGDGQQARRPGELP